MAVPEDQRRDDNPGNPWAPPWPDEIARKVAKRETRSTRETLSRAKHPTAFRVERDERLRRQVG